MKVYRYLPAEFAVKALSERRFKLSEASKVNDPDEFCHYTFPVPHFEDVWLKFKQEIAVQYGFLCFSDTWRKQLMWASYSKQHTGVCLGIEIDEATETSGTEGWVKKIIYYQDRKPFPLLRTDEDKMSLLREMFFLKHNKWKDEDEYRLYAKLNDKAGNGLYYLPWSTEVILKEVIIGNQCGVTKQKIVHSIDPKYGDQYTLWKIRPDANWSTDETREPL